MTKFNFDSTKDSKEISTRRGFKRNKNKCNFHYIAMSMVTSQILKSVDFTKIEKSRYLEDKTFFLQIKILITHQELPHGKK